MNEKLQQAITATRNGQVIEAQLLLTQALKDDPDDAQAWFLLSNLVDSDQKKIAYLGKTLALNPQHEMAQKMLLRLRGPDVDAGETAVIAPEENNELTLDAGEIVEPETAETEDVDLIADLAEVDILADGDDIPNWLVEEELTAWEEDTSEAVEVSDNSELEVKIEEMSESAVPDWLQEEPTEMSKTMTEESAAVESNVPAPVEDEPDIVVMEQKTAVTLADDHQKQHTFLTRLLYALVTVTGVILIVFLYLILTSL